MSNFFFHLDLDVEKNKSNMRENLPGLVRKKNSNQMHK
jgi:hypothetical protein